MVHSFFKDIASNKIVQAMAVAVLLVVAYEFRLILALAFFAFTLSSALLPVVHYLERRHIPRILSVLIPYLVGLAVIFGGAYLLAPPVISQAKEIAGKLPQDFDQLTQSISPLLGNLHLGETVQKYFTSSPGFGGSIISIPVSMFEGIIYAFTVLIMSIYLLLDRDRFLLRLERRRPFYARLLEESETNLGNWVRGQLILSAAIGILVTIGFFIIGVPFPVVIGIISAVFEFIPYLGPILSGAVGVIIAANVSLAKAALALAVFFLVQQLESHVLTPQIMKYSTEVHPVIVILSILAGFQFGGIIGAIIAIPLVSTVALIWNRVESENAAEV